VGYHYEPPTDGQEYPEITVATYADGAEFLPIAVACLQEHGIVLDHVESLEHLATLLSEQQIEDAWGCTAPPYSGGDFPVP